MSFKNVKGITFKNEEFGEDIFVSGYKIAALDAKRDLVDMNKNMIGLFLIMTSLKLILIQKVKHSGAQFVCMNYQ